MSYSYNLTGENREVVEHGITQSPEVSIGNLTAFTRFKFAVAAVTSAGRGPWSAFVSAKTKEAGTIKCTYIINFKSYEVFHLFCNEIRGSVIR